MYFLLVVPLRDGNWGRSFSIFINHNCVMRVNKWSWTQNNPSSTLIKEMTQKKCEKNSFRETIARISSNHTTGLLQSIFTRVTNVIESLEFETERRDSWDLVSQLFFHSEAMKITESYNRHKLTVLNKVIDQLNAVFREFCSNFMDYIITSAWTC